MKVADAVAQALKAEGVEYLICYPRQSLIDACTKIGIRPVICRQERVGVGIPDGISRSTQGRRIGVFAMQAGPGIENAFPGVAQVFGDNVPVLLLPGGLLARRDTPPTFDAVENFRRVTKFVADMSEPGRVSELMRRAFHQLRSGKPGPVLIQLPTDTDAEVANFQYTPVKPVRAAPDPADVRNVAELLLKARCPVIHAGQGILYSGATKELVRLAELIGAPVLTTNTGKSAIDLFVRVSVSKHPYFGRKGDHLTLQVPVTFAEAVLGTQVSVPTPDGPVTLKVPAGTRSGRTFRVKGRGFPTKGGRGDLLVTVEVDVPTTVRDEERAALEAYAQVATADPRAHLREVQL